jgi:hypothetical protein
MGGDSAARQTCRATSGRRKPRDLYADGRRPATHGRRAEHVERHHRGQNPRPCLSEQQLCPVSVSVTRSSPACTSGGRRFGERRGATEHRQRMLAALTGRGEA